LGYNTKDKKGNKLSFGVDLSYNQIITGDNTQSDDKLKWGITCDASNSCTDFAPSAAGLTYDMDTVKVGD